MPPIHSAFVDDIEKLTVENSYYRNVIFTTDDKGMQLVLMSLKSGEDIGEEIHPNVNQFFRIEQGQGKVVYKDEKKERDIKDDDAIIIPAGMLHNIVNTGNKDLKFYSIYTPANHPHNTIDKTKEDADKREHH